MLNQDKLPLFSIGVSLLNSFIISSVRGVTKPNELMYKAALEELKLSLQEAIFIDDNIKNCDGAKNLGI